MKEILFRLETLKSANLINQEDINEIIKLLEYINKNYGVEIKEENTSMLVTHIAMMKNRMSKSEVSDMLDIDTIEELKEYKEYNFACDILEHYNKNILSDNLHENEKAYIITHLITLLGGK